MFSVLDANTRLNPGQVKIKNSAVSDQAKDMQYQLGADRKILSNIVFGSPQNNSTHVNVLSLSDEINGLDLGAQTRLVIKMDIEGAEWKILRDRKTLQTLGEARAELILALHPGFYRPLTQSHWTKFIKLQIFRLMNFCEAWGLYKNLSEHSEIKRTNLNNVPTALRFSMLVMSGCHEFLVEFNSNSLPKS
jgi:FkbM family methyltransferase